jgi:hypothetical protein
MKILITPAKSRRFTQSRHQLLESHPLAGLNKLLVLHTGDQLFGTKTPSRDSAIPRAHAPKLQAGGTTKMCSIDAYHTNAASFAKLHLSTLQVTQKQVQ